MKQCTICKILKQDTEYHKNKQKPDGLESRCKICRSNINKINKEKNSKKQHEYYLKNKDKILTRNKIWSNNNPDKVKNQKLKYAYGITLLEFNQKLKKQNNFCKICNKSLLNLDSKKIHVDHDHKTGRVRGILCHKCNSLLGLCNDNKIVLENAISYLNK